ncbi:MAG: HD domain-containing protein [Methanothrix sp.]
MDIEVLEGLLSWFSGYVQAFKTGDFDADRNIILKEDHTFRVRGEIRDIGLSLALPGEDLCLAEAAALLHDIGRFPQYAMYKTFSDLRSCDHAALSVQVLREEGVLDGIDPGERELILRAISYHNRASIPEEESDGRCLFFSRLLRDADKLDVWALLIDYHHQRRIEGRRNPALEMDLPDGPGVSEKVSLDIRRGEIVKVKDLENSNDFKLLLASWIFDINFRSALVSVRDRGYLDTTRDLLPWSGEVDLIFDLLRSRLDERIGPGDRRDGVAGLPSP